MNSFHEEVTWVDSYYEALEFFYWEPQHLGRKKHSNPEFNTAPKVRKHLRKMEVTLNQNLHQFFLLAPDTLRNELFGRLFGKTLQGCLTLEGRNVDEKFKLQNSTQPDILFTSEADTVALEMKVGSKSSLTQVLKYALLGLAVELKLGSEKEHFLGFLGSGSFADQWKERFDSIEGLRHALAEVDCAPFLEKQTLYFREHATRFAQIVKGLSFCFVTYEELAGYLLRESPLPSDISPSAQVYRKLIEGVTGEFRLRKLMP